VLTEMTANAHAYLVTFISGPKAFALLAIGSLFMRPVSLCLTALPDLERPTMARQIAAGEFSRARRLVTEFRGATSVVWAVTVALAVVLLLWFPELVLKKGYDQLEALAVLGLWALIMAVRTFRTPESVFLQSAREFRALAGASVWSSLASLILTLGLLLTVGPVASLTGVLIGDLVMASRISSLSRAWRRRHG
jgi:O-antigen/teichoic acid export membrane protein